MSEQNGFDSHSEDALWELSKRIDLRNLSRHENSQDESLIREALQQNHSSSPSLPDFSKLMRSDLATEPVPGESTGNNRETASNPRYVVGLWILIVWAVGFSMGGLVFFRRTELAETPGKPESSSSQLVEVKRTESSNAPVAAKTPSQDMVDIKFGRQTLIKYLQKYKDDFTPRSNRGQLGLIANTFADTAESTPEERAALDALLKELERALAKPVESGPR